MNENHESSSSFLAKNAKTLNRELGRMFIAARDCRNAGMQWNEIPVPVGAVDEFWHDFVVSDDYSDFCMAHVGEEIAHIDAKDPNGIGTGCGQIRWVTQYEERFGRLDPIWFTDGNGRFDALAYARYQRDGVMLMPWNCNPKGLN